MALSHRHASLTLLFDVVDPVSADGRIVKQGSALGGRVALGEPFEGIEQDVMRK
jgi:hypothetical protein